MRMGGPAFSERILLLPFTVLSTDHLNMHPLPPDAEPTHTFSADGTRVVPRSEGASEALAASFNRLVKIDRETWEVWVRLLERAPHVRLWLLEHGARAASALRRLRKALQKRKISNGSAPSRLVSSGLVGEEEHIAQKAMALLHLDSLSYGAHGTAADALWAGVPTLSRSGPRLCDRIGASMNAAMDLEILTARNAGEYLELAVRLLGSEAGQRKLSTIRRRVQMVRSKSLVFNTAAWIRGWERALLSMVRLWEASDDRVSHHLILSSE